MGAPAAPSPSLPAPTGAWISILSERLHFNMIELLLPGDEGWWRPVLSFIDTKACICIAILQIPVHLLGITWAFLPLAQEFVRLREIRLQATPTARSIWSPAVADSVGRPGECGRGSAVFFQV